MGDMALTEAEYRDALKTCALASMFIERVNIPDLLARIERADAFGAVLDPTLYRDKRQAMMEDKELLEAAKPLWEYAQKVRESLRQKESERRKGEERESNSGTVPRP